MLSRKRGVIFFVATFMIPLIFVVAVSISTFSIRQKTTRNLLESNLWLSGQSALDQIDSEFDEIEKKWLNDAFFSNLQKVDSLRQFDTYPELFLIDKDYRVIYPETAKDRNPDLATYNKNWNSDYMTYMEIAQNEELAMQNYSRASKNYQTSLGFARTPQQKALAIEGLARSNLSDHNYQQAIPYYRLLKNEYSQTVNLGGFPYGISAPLQLYTIGALIGEEVIGTDSLLETYQMIMHGNWLITSSSYFFFKSEFESILKIDIEPMESRFERIQRFDQFLSDFVIPTIKERSGFPEVNHTGEIRRALLHSDESQYLISYREMQFPDTDHLLFGGIRWNLDSIVAKVIPPILANLKGETGLEFLIIDSKNNNLSTGEAAQIPEEALTLSFRDIPFPWTLIASQPEYKKLQANAKIQLIIYGILVVIIIILMLFGAYVLLRDISRENDLMQLQTEFIHNVSHELKTPLSLIRLYGETLIIKEHLPETDRKEGLEIICKESERLSFMINNILDFSKIEMGRKELNLKPENLSEVVRNTLDSYRYHLVKKGFITEEEIDQNIPPVLCDKNAMEGILINLFSNAIKFSNSTKRMSVRLTKSPGEITLAVSDNGIGIPPDELSLIFNRFYRVKSFSDFNTSGSGLGLTLVKHVVDAHGWKIEVESTPGQGTTFSISIPQNTYEEDPL